MNNNNNTYRISFTRTFRIDIAPTFALTAVSDNGKSRQTVGRVRVPAPKQFEVATVNGTPIGTATSRAQVIAMIDAHHREHNADDYWMWADQTLLVRGKAV